MSEAASTSSWAAERGPRAVGMLGMMDVQDVLRIDRILNKAMLRETLLSNLEMQFKLLSVPSRSRCGGWRW